MSELQSDRICELAIEALERTAFVLAEPCDEEQAGDFHADLASRVSFTGFTNGAVVLSADRAFVAELAASMMGVDESEVTAELEGRDALNELANIVGGSIITELGGRDQTYEYSVPQVVDVNETLQNAVHTVVAAEEGLLQIAWLDTSAEKAAA